MRSQSVLVGMVLGEEVHRKRSQALIPSLCGILVQYILMKQQV